jgi:dihydrofolate synthase/folylpolyglutamate synthase
MGGLTDATNVIDRPLLSVITGISVDHTSFLGNTVEEIAAQKAGIIKHNCLTLWCGSDPAAEAVCRAVAEAKNSPFHTVPRETLQIKRANLSGTLFDFDGKADLPLSMLGLYQADNAANALTAADLLRAQGWRIPESALREGLRTVRWKGRFEILSQSPLVIADGGHNPEGIARAAESVEAYFPHTPVCFVTGIMADKDYRAVAARLAPLAARVFCLTPHNSRALPAADYAEVFRALGVSAQACTDGADALCRAVDEGHPVVCLGSLYMYAELKDAVDRLRK